VRPESFHKTFRGKPRGLLRHEGGQFPDASGIAEKGGHLRDGLVVRREPEFGEGNDLTGSAARGNEGDAAHRGHFRHGDAKGLDPARVDRKGWAERTFRFSSRWRNPGVAIHPPWLAARSAMLLA